MSNIELEDDIALAKFINYMPKALYHKYDMVVQNMNKIGIK